MRTRVVFNQKGGVGKSTITCNLAAIAAEHGHRTLVIDLDVQGNSSHYLLGENWQTNIPNSADVCEQILNFSFYPKPLPDFIVATPFPRLSLLAASPRLEELQLKLEARYKIYKLRELLATVREQFDLVFIDTPPAFNFYSRTALIAADRCLIPFDCDEFSRQALFTLRRNLEELRADHNPNLQLEGIVVNQFQPRSSLPARIVESLRAEGLPICQPPLASSVKVRESHEAAQPLIYFAPKHKLTLAYQTLFSSLEH